MARNSSIWMTVLLILMWVGIVIVADLNWPSHMGEQGALLKAIGLL
jgi:hypothetical protein